MDISSFDDLLQVARAQTEPQRLLFVFAGAELPDDATPAERAQFEQGQGGALTPIMCVDKAPAELATFETLVEEARDYGTEWAIVFVAALSGQQGQAPSDDAAEGALNRMVASIKAGQFGAFIPFDRQGVGVMLN
jgi:hypothetical protein